MENKERNLEFFTSDHYKYQLDIWYKAHNISHEKIELFRDFLFGLYETIEQTYLGADVTVLDIDQKNHFTWCWNKIIELFDKERIYFKDKGIHYEYFWGFFQEAYYVNHINENPIKITQYFDIIFDFNHKKTRAEMDVLTEIYKLLNENLKK